VRGLIPEEMKAIAGTISNGRLVEVGRAGHLSVVEQLEASREVPRGLLGSLDGDPR
jgi:hypothetical protein